MGRTTAADRTAASEWFAGVAARAAADDHRPGRQLALVERALAEDEMVPLHRRDEDETLRVLDGEVTFWVGDDVVVAGPDDVVVAPAGVARTARGGPGGGRWLVLTRVAALDRFVDFGRARTRLRSRGWTAQEHAAVSTLAAANGIELLGPPGRLPG